MKLINYLLASGLLVSGSAASYTPVGPNPDATTTQIYEIPSGAPTDVYIWKDDYTGLYGGKDTTGKFYCGSNTAQQSCVQNSNDTSITILLTEKRSKMTHRITLVGYLNSLHYDADNPADTHFCGNKEKLNSGNSYECSGDWTNTRLLNVYIPQSEMNSLPVGGVWEGTAHLTYEGSTNISYTANIVLKGKATGKQDIYFPEFNGASPLVQLDLHPTGSVTGNNYVEDVTNLDMCLYDGFNSNSDSMELSFKDEGKAGAGRKNGYFSIYNTTTNGTDFAERIDYRVEMFDPHSKSWMPVKNNDSFTLSAGVNGQDQIRPVRLPSITYPVLCAPAPLRLIVDKFSVMSKMAGYYKGVLTVSFSPSLNSI